MTSESDYCLGQRIAALWADPGSLEQAPGHSLSSRLSSQRLLAQVQDLVGADTALLGPMRDLLLRPAFRSLLGVQPGAAQLAVRDALLHDLLATYQPQLVARLGTVLDGCLGLAPAPRPETAASTPPPRQGDGQPPHGARSNPKTVAPPALMLVCGLLGGGLITALAWIALGTRPLPPQTGSDPVQPGPTLLRSDPAAAVRPLPFEALKPTGSWGPPERYKFGQAPSSRYPESCAFSASDASGQHVIDPTRIEYWACRRLEPQASGGHRVQWADGGITTYRFSSDGGGSITGTQGDEASIRWRNGSHRGTAIVVIEHPDGGETWIPGRVESQTL